MNKFPEDDLVLTNNAWCFGEASKNTYRLCTTPRVVLSNGIELRQSLTAKFNKWP